MKLHLALPKRYWQELRWGTFNGDRKHNFYDPKLAKKLVGGMVRQGWYEKKIVETCLNRKNMGTYWFRCQPDTVAAVLKMISEVRQDSLPMMPMKVRMAKLLNLLATGQVWSQKSLVEAVGTAYKRDVYQDLEYLIEHGAIDVEKVIHGKTTWYRISIAVTIEKFGEIAGIIGRTIAKKLSILYAKDNWFVDKVLHKGLATETPPPIPIDLQLLSLVT